MRPDPLRDRTHPLIYRADVKDVEPAEMRYVIRFKHAAQYFCAFHFEIDARVFMTHLRHLNNNPIGYELIDVRAWSVIDQC